jgi:hypothetical protein
MAFLRKIIIIVIHHYLKNGTSLPTNVVPSTLFPRISWQAVTLDSTGGRDVSPSVTMSPQIWDFLEKLLSLSYFKNGASLRNVIPGTAGRTHGVASHDLRLGVASCDPGLTQQEEETSVHQQHTLDANWLFNQ